MVVFSQENEVACSIPPARLFKAIILDADNLIPKVAPHAIKKCETLEGNGGVGTIKLIHYGEGSEHKTVKHRIDAIDEANYEFKYSEIEGGELEEGGLDLISHHLKIEAGPDGGSIYKAKTEYHSKGEVHHSFKEKIKHGKEKVKEIVKSIEAHLHGHPKEYCD